MDEPRVDTDAEIHLVHQCRGVGQRHPLRDVVHVQSHVRPHGLAEGVVRRDVGRSSAEHDLATSRVDEPADEPLPAVGRPMLERVGRPQGHKDPLPAGWELIDQRANASSRRRRHPVLIAGVIDRKPLGPQQVEIGLHLVPAATPADTAGEERTRLASKPDTTRNPGERRQRGGREGWLEQVRSRVAAGLQPVGLRLQRGERGSEAPAAFPWRTAPGHAAVDVGAVREHCPRPPLRTDVDHGIGVGQPEVPQKRDRQERVADVLRADDEDPLLGPRRFVPSRVAHRAKPTKKLNSCLLSYGA